MTEVNKNRAKTDEAWERLYARLDKDRLLVEAGQGRAVRRKLLLKWGTLAAAVIAGFVYLASALWFVPGGEVENLNLVTQENREASMLVTTLEDGSVVYLAQESTLQYPENHEQTFLIETGKVRIEVLGTAFNVRSHEDDFFRLSVQRGRVKVSLKQGGQSVLVSAGETVTLQARQLQLSETEDSDEFRQYTKNIRFKDECLEDILRVVNAEAPTLQIQVASSVLNKRKLTIEFENNSPETVAELICWALSLKYSREGDKLILSE